MISQIEREKTKGAGWFDMKAPEMTEEIQRDLELLKMRSVLDPKRHYKNNDMKASPNASVYCLRFRSIFRLLERI